MDTQDTGPAYTRMRLPLARGPPDPLLSQPYSISRIQRVFTEMTLRLQSGPHCITACHTYLYSSRARTRRSSLDEKLSPSGARLCHPSACHIIRAHRRPPAHVVPAPAPHTSSLQDFESLLFGNVAHVVNLLLGISNRPPCKTLLLGVVVFQLVAPSLPRSNLAFVPFTVIEPLLETHTDEWMCTMLVSLRRDV